MTKHVQIGLGNVTMWPQKPSPFTIVLLKNRGKK